MADFTLSVDATYVSMPKEELSKLIDIEVERFSAYMATIGDWKAVGPLNAMERTLVKTYIGTKLKGLY